MKKFYIHIGRPKVGSSAIQHFLFINRELLLDEFKILYPKAGIIQRASHKLALVYLPNFNDSCKVKGTTGKSIFRELFEEILSSNATGVVLSSENFYFVDPKKLPQKIKKNFDCKIICYVRRQDEVLISSFIQEIKENAIDLATTFEDYTSNDLRMTLLDYYPILHRWADVFGKNNIIVRVYEKEQMKENIFFDFLDAIGVSSDVRFTIPNKRLNPSPSRDVLEYIHLINQFDADESVYRSLRLPLLEISERLGSPDALDSKNIFSIDQRLSIMKRYEDANALIAREFLARSDGKLFFEEPETKRCQAFDYPGITLDRLSMITAGLFLQQADTYFKLREKLVNSERRIAALEKIIRNMTDANNENRGPTVCESSRKRKKLRFFGWKFGQ